MIKGSNGVTTEGTLNSFLENDKRLVPHMSLLHPQTLLPQNPTLKGPMVEAYPDVNNVVSIILVDAQHVSIATREDTWQGFVRSRYKTQGVLLVMSVEKQGISEGIALNLGTRGETNKPSHSPWETGR